MLATLHRCNPEMTDTFAVALREALERFSQKWELDSETGCWLWLGKPSYYGYGVFCLLGPKRVPAHRWSYEQFVGPIPDGLTIDHVWDRGCRHRHCVNPEHLEAVTKAVNSGRGERSRRTHCPQGHEYTEANTRHEKTGRKCRTCSSVKVLAWKRAKRA